MYEIIFCIFIVLVRLIMKGKMACKCFVYYETFGRKVWLRGSEVVHGRFLKDKTKDWSLCCASTLTSYSLRSHWPSGFHGFRPSLVNAKRSLNAIGESLWHQTIWGKAKSKIGYLLSRFVGFFWIQMLSMDHFNAKLSNHFELQIIATCMKDWEALW